MTNATDQCPIWCDSAHLTSRPAHHAEVGQVQISTASRVDISLADYADAYGYRVNMHIYCDGEEEAGHSLTVREAKQLYLLLGEALEALGEGFADQPEPPASEMDERLDRIEALVRANDLLLSKVVERLVPDRAEVTA